MFPLLFIVLGIVVFNWYGSVFFTVIPVICCGCRLGCFDRRGGLKRQTCVIDKIYVSVAFYCFGYCCFELVAVGVVHSDS